MTQQQFLEQLNNILDQNHLLKHPFYQMWNEGKLDLAMLQEYAQEYYLQVHNFPTYVSATHAACDDIKIRQMLLENLIEEERGAANHPELWLRFAEGLGLDRNAVIRSRTLRKNHRIRPHSQRVSAQRIPRQRFSRPLRLRSANPRSFYNQNRWFEGILRHRFRSCFVFL